MKNILLSGSLITAVLLSSCSKSTDQKQASSTHDERQNSSDYPLETCVVSGEKLGSMGEPVVFDHDGTTVKFCCKSCIKRFKKNPDKYLAKLKK